MTITATNIRRLGGSGGIFSNLVTFTMDSSYATGGEAVTADMVGLSSIKDLVPLSSPSGWDVAWDQDNLKLLVFGSSGGTLATISRTFTTADMTDGGSTSGFVDFVQTLPIGAIPLASELAVSGAFLGDTTAVWKIGTSGTTDAYSLVTTNSCFTAITTNSIVKDASALGGGAEAAVTPRITVTSSTDFTLVKTNATGAATANIHYLLPRANVTGAIGAMAEFEARNTQDLSTVVFRALVFGNG